MNDFLHTYGAFIIVVLVLLSPLMLLVFCRLFLSSRSDQDDSALREKTVASRKDLTQEGRAVPDEAQKRM